jgi:hypothetical protein
VSPRGDDGRSASKSYILLAAAIAGRVYCVPVVVRVIGKNRIMIYGPKDDVRCRVQTKGKLVNSRDRACRGRPVQSSPAGTR